MVHPTYRNAEMQGAPGAQWLCSPEIEAFVIRRFLTLGSGEAVSRLLYLLAFVALARGLGKAALGEFGLALTVTSYLVLTVQQGFDQIAVRAVARDPALLQTYVRGLAGLRLSIAAMVYLLLAIYLQWHPAGPPESSLLLILGAICFTTAAAPRWAFQLLSPRRFALANIFSQLIFCAGALAAISGKGIGWAAGSYLLGDAVAAAYLLRSAREHCDPSPAWSPPFWRILVSQSWPLSLSAVLGIVVYNFDILALGWLATPSDVGLYLACYRCVTVFSPLISVLQLSILPAYANAFPDRQRLKEGIRKVSIPSIAAACLVALTLNFYPRELLHLIYGNDYAGGAAILRLLAWSLPLQVFRSVLRQVLLAANLQSLDTVNMAMAAIVSIAIDIAFIPHLGPFACAIATVSSEATLLIAAAAVLRIKVFPRSSRRSATLKRSV